MVETIESTCKEISFASSANDSTIAELNDLLFLNLGFEAVREGFVLCYQIVIIRLEDGGRAELRGSGGGPFRSKTFGKKKASVNNETLFSLNLFCSPY